MKRIFIFYDSDFIDVLEFTSQEKAKSAFSGLICGVNKRYSYKLGWYETLQALFNTTTLPTICFKFNHFNCMVFGGS